jgi:hypothetical protein
LEYLAKHNIDRNEVSRQIAEITSRMIYITGAKLFVVAPKLLPLISSSRRNMNRILSRRFVRSLPLSQSNAPKLTRHSIYDIDTEEIC